MKRRKDLHADDVVPHVRAGLKIYATAEVNVTAHAAGGCKYDHFRKKMMYVLSGVSAKVGDITLSYPLSVICPKTYTSEVVKRHTNRDVDRKIIAMVYHVK